MTIRRKPFPFGRQPARLIASGLFALYCAVAGAGEPGRLVQVAAPISLEQTPAAPSRESASKPADLFAESDSVVQVSMKSRGVQTPPLITPAQPMTLTTSTPAVVPAVTVPDETETDQPEKEDVAVVPTVLNPRRIENDEYGLHSEESTAVARPQSEPEEPQANPIFYRGEIDRLARHSLPKDGQSSPAKNRDSDSLRLELLDFLATASGDLDERRDAFEVSLLHAVQLSQLESPPLPLIPADADPADADPADADPADADPAEESLDSIAAAEEPSEAKSAPLEDGLISIADTVTSIAPSDGMMPEDYAAPRFREAGELPMPEGANRDWPMYAFWWEAPGSVHQPLYFEQPNLERYGYGKGLAQPVLSGAHFFATVPALPYLMAADPPGEPIYTLGHYRPGSWAPYQLHYPPLSLKGALAEGGVMTGLIFLIP